VEMILDIVDNLNLSELSEVQTKIQTKIEDRNDRIAKWKSSLPAPNPERFGPPVEQPKFVGHRPQWASPFPAPNRDVMKQKREEHQS